MGKEKILYSLISALPSAINFGIAILLLNNSLDITPSFYMSSLFLQFGGGIASSYFGFRHSTIFKINKLFKLFVFGITFTLFFLELFDVLVFCCGVIFTLIYNKVLYEKRITYSFIIGFYSSIALSATYLVNVIFLYDSTYFYTIMILSLTLIILFFEKQKDSFEQTIINYSKFFISFLFGFTSVLILLISDDFSVLFVDKILISSIPIINAHFIRKSSIEGDFSFLSIFISKLYWRYYYYVITFTVFFITGYNDYIILIFTYPLLFLSALIFRKIQVLNIKVFYGLPSILLLLPIYFLNHKLIYFTFWLFILEILIKTNNENNL